MQWIEHIEASAPDINRSSIETGEYCRETNLVCSPATLRSKSKGRRRLSRALLSLFGAVILIVAAFAFVATGFRLGHTFSDISSQDASARSGNAPDTSYPCGVEMPCFDKSRYQPVWL